MAAEQNSGSSVLQQLLGVGKSNDNVQQPPALEGRKKGKRGVVKKIGKTISKLTSDVPAGISQTDQQQSSASTTRQKSNAIPPASQAMRNPTQKTQPVNVDDGIFKKMQPKDVKGLPADTSGSTPTSAVSQTGQQQTTGVSVPSDAGVHADGSNAAAVPESPADELIRLEMEQKEAEKNQTKLDRKKAIKQKVVGVLGLGKANKKNDLNISDEGNDKQKAGNVCQRIKDGWNSLNQQEKGCAIVIVILVIAIIAVIAYVIYVIVKNNNHEKAVAADGRKSKWPPVWDDNGDYPSYCVTPANAIGIVIHCHYMVKWPMFENVGKIEQAFLYENKWNAVPEYAFAGFSNLALLDLSDNGISTISINSFNDLRRLETLRLAGNGISNIDWSVFSSLKRLKLINLANNSIKALPASLLSEITTLRTIQLSTNRIETIDEHAFSKSPKLQELRLAHNRLSNLPRLLFAGMESLEYLDLSSNQITSIHSELFDDSIALATLLLQGNNIATITKNTFQNINTASSSKLHLNLSNNDITEIQNGAFNKRITMQYFDLRFNIDLPCPDLFHLPTSVIILHIPSSCDGACKTNERCLNGGSCIRQEETNRCLCHNGYTGINCERDVDECSTNPCKSGHHCQNKEGTYECICIGARCGGEAVTRSSTAITKTNRTGTQLALLIIGAVAIIACIYLYQSSKASGKKAVKPRVSSRRWGNI